ncbi:hypothetical protein DVH24_024932 [Malus domestica]|uniref:Uncharacterized protein n=1 Tax=Malus domestica TaxID=3750 RepID=A0A498JHS1_MALDO|nr:hypothetical protein DVH24_024932 [Malus domestica]
MGPRSSSRRQSEANFELQGYKDIFILRRSGSSAKPHNGQPNLISNLLSMIFESQTSYLQVKRSTTRL